jgi:hypothetical protein
MTRVKVTGPVTQGLSGCAHYHRQGDQLYHQAFRCEYQLGEVTTSP